MDTNTRILALCTLALASFAQMPAFAQVANVLDAEPANDVAFKDTHPDCGILRHGDQIARVYGHFASGNSPSDSALNYIDEHALSLYGVNPADLAPIGPFEGGEHLLQLMPDDFGNFKFTAVYFEQQVKGIPVYKGGLIVLTRNESGFPAVLASSTLWDVRGFDDQLAGVKIGTLPSAKLWTRNAMAEFSVQPEFSPAQYVVWAGIDRIKAAPRLAVLVTGEAGSPADPDNHQRIEFVIDAKTGEILHQENKICNAVSGRVTGNATPGFGADTCAVEVSTGIPYVGVRSLESATTYSGSGTSGTSTFVFQFKVLQASDLVVTKTNDSTGVETTLMPTSPTSVRDYTLTLNTNQNTNPGGSITTAIPITAGNRLRIAIGNAVAYADADGNYSTSAGAAGALYSTLVGRWFTTSNNGAAALTLSATANDGANWSPVFNAANNVEAERAQVNAYIMANKTRDMVLSAAPSFPTVATQANTFQVNCNLSSTCNAYYTANTITFCVAGGPVGSACTNTAFGDVVAHEFGHNVVEKGGSGQGAYGEGFGDIHGLLLSDNPATGIGFQTCANGIRTAQNTCQFSASGCSTGTTSYGATCDSEIHSCGQLISGCVWDLRNRFRTLYPATYRTLLTRLCVNSIPLHGAIATIANDITVDFLTLDDDDANIGNGTPNYTAINDSFTIHGLPGPALSLLNISFPGGQPTLASPSGSTILSVKIDPSLETANPSMAKLYAKSGSAPTYTAYPMTAGASNTYTVNLPAATCLTTMSYYLSVQTTAGSTVSSPSNAPVSLYTVQVAGSSADIDANDFEGAASWTSGATGDTATTGQWVLANPVGTTAQPEDDHTAAPGVKCWFTGQGTVGGDIGAADVDGGVATLVSPTFNCTGYAEVQVSYWRWYSNNLGSQPATNTFPIDVSSDNGATWVNLETVSQAAGETAAWVQKSFKLNGLITPSAQVKFRFRATDTTGAVVEAAIDDFRLIGRTCPVARPADVNRDGVVNGIDLGVLLAYWGAAGGDLNGDGNTDGADLAVLLGDWG